MNSPVFWIIWMVVALWCGTGLYRLRLSTTLSTTPHLGCTCCHLLNHRPLMLHPNEHVGNLDLLQELSLREKGPQRHTIRPLYLICTTWTADLRPQTLIDVAAATPEETETPSRSLRVLETDYCVQPTAPLLVRVWDHFVRCCVAVTSHPQPLLRRGQGVYCGCQPGPTACGTSIQADVCLRGCLWSESCLW